ncbi:MAG: LOW QUALITY PROTEIN: hypothetical protein BJ554DRAFT_5446 [Olpidium bornovanus]|uniref:Uncharacterized protein n=1 Tax=Olpidium bornovanus TaxID=278681 RepID=A0A8H7ZZ79_9FUNG|nr:MAG: LOW QUALITY PROTEIN: hypothetical protein BJ554DRAFT_5446 [Olpidium bornovanus]
MGATNSVGHVQAKLSEIFGAFIPRVTLPFIDDLPMRGGRYDTRDEYEVTPGVQKFVHDHAQDVAAILRRAIKAWVTFSVELRAARDRGGRVRMQRGGASAGTVEGRGHRPDGAVRVGEQGTSTLGHGRVLPDVYSPLHQCRRAVVWLALKGGGLSVDREVRCGAGWALPLGTSVRNVDIDNIRTRAEDEIKPGASAPAAELRSGRGSNRSDGRCEPEGGRMGPEPGR